ncbi:MAG: DNA double-strand break repair nuclease NurA, partial [Thermoproteota archaeon]
MSAVKPAKKSVIARLPPTVREQYFSVFVKPEPEMVHPDLYKLIIDDGTDVILNEVKRYNEARKQLIKEIRDKLSVKQAKCDEAFANDMSIVASDAGNNGVDLRSAFAPLYAATALVAKGWKILDEPISRAGKPELWAGEYKPEQRESLLAMKLQFEATYEAVEKWSPQLVVFDGPLLLHYGLMPGPEATDEYWQDFKDTALSIIKFLRFCCERDIPVAGFVKRTRMAKLGEELQGFLPTARFVRDTALLDLVLRLGQYTLLEVEPPRGGVVNQYRAAGEELGLLKDEIDKLTNFHSAYIRTGLTTPFRLEFPEYCVKRLDEVATVLYTTSEEDGIPFAINEVDKLTRITNAIANIRSLMLFSKALDLVKNGEMSPEDLNLLALQYGEAWTLREERYFQDVQELQGG